MVIGAGASGVFCSIRFAELSFQKRICILEAGIEPLSKVKISGGGRCNVTTSISDPQDLVNYYPRGSKEMLGPFYKFGPRDMQEWLEEKNVQLKTEADGRMFPVSNRSQTIIDCFMNAIHKNGIVLKTKSRAKKILWNEEEKLWNIELDEQIYTSKLLLLATGSDARSWELLNQLGHQIIPPVPSLFSFNIPDVSLQKLTGLSVPIAQLEIIDQNFKAEGPLLITHWGLSGPAILKLSAWGARWLHENHYEFNLRVKWIPLSKIEVIHHFQKYKQAHAEKKMGSGSLFELPLRLWQYHLQLSGIGADLKWVEIKQNKLEILAASLTEQIIRVKGKTTFKEEFVTAGGVRLSEVDFRTFQSKLHPQLYLAGEVLDIDALTGGFNFQAAWTSAWLAAESMSQYSYVEK